MLLVSLYPKGITLSGFHCNNNHSDLVLLFELKTSFGFTGNDVNSLFASMTMDTNDAQLLEDLVNTLRIDDYKLSLY